MATYEYSRELITSGEFNDGWDIPNPTRLDGEGNIIQLGTEIISGLPTKSLINGASVVCDGSVCEIKFTEALTVEEETTLDAIVATHKTIE